MLRTHGRFEYESILKRGPPEGLSWPGGQKLAVYVALNLEHFEFGQGLGGVLVPGENSLHSPDVLNYSWREYGNRVGAWRLLELFDDLKMPCSALVNGAITQHCPELIQAHVARGDEIVGHGWTNAEKQADLDEYTEVECIRQTTRSLQPFLKTVSNDCPTGWLGPWISQSYRTLDLLVQQKYQYHLDWCHDDAPTYMNTKFGPILSIPYPQELNDIPTIMVRRASATEFADMIIDNFDEMLQQANRSKIPLVMGIALHGYIVGQPFRLRQLRRALQHIVHKANDGTIWLTTAGEINSAFRDISPPT